MRKSTSPTDARYVIVDMNPTKMKTAVRPLPPLALHGVSYGQYVSCRSDPANGSLRMTYHNGILELTAPQYYHEAPALRLGSIVRVVAEAFDVPFEGTRSTTFRRGVPGLPRGQGKEADEGFYFTNAGRILGKSAIDLDAGDPPPDLWIEVDHRSSSKVCLPVYAALGDPEVWRYWVRSKKLVFVRLTDGGSYKAIDRSLSLPMLTPALVLEALELGAGVLESVWLQRLRAWVDERLGKP